MEEKNWLNLRNRYTMTPLQVNQFQNYLKLLLEENEKYNLTAIIQEEGVVSDHFLDSLALLDAYDLKKVHTIIDVGSGAGFPGIPLAIMNSHIQFCLVEVNLKKVNFLMMVIDHLGLQNVTICSVDWRTFLRTQVAEIVQEVPSQSILVIARASLAVDELFRMFKPSSLLQDATFVYWASQMWQPTIEEEQYLNRCLEYPVASKTRKLCFFTKQGS